MTFDARKIFEEVKANIAKLDGCKRHLFKGGAPDLGKKKRCEKCGGEMSLSDVAMYIKGYESAGRSASDIWPEYGNGQALRAKH